MRHVPGWMTRISCFAAAACLVATNAAAQSINFDYSVNDGGGTWIGAPADTFGGKHGQTGHWIHSGPFISYTNLVGINGNLTLADLVINGGGPVHFVDHPSLSGETEVLMGDWLNADPGDPITLTFTSLIPGVYTLYTYSNNLLHDTYRTNVAVVPSIDVVQTVGGDLTSNTLTLGLNYTKHRLYTSNGTITVGISAHTTKGSFNGIQLVFHGRVAPTMYVDQDATSGAAGGTSWANACLRLDDALTVADLTGSTVQQIWVAEGSYRPTRNGDRNVSLVIPDGVKVYGGFAGTERSLDQRDVEANVTTLTGGINLQITATDNSYHVVDLEGTGDETRLDGFRIQSGYASGPTIDQYGGGLWMVDSSATIANCVIANNHAQLIGGGMYCTGDSPLFVNCTFLDNDADTQGGGAYVGGAATSVVAFVNCRFLGNQSDSSGGGLRIVNKDVAFVNSIFSGNTSGINGGAFDAQIAECSVVLYNCALSGNSAANHGGGVYLSFDADATIVNSILWGNTDGDILTNTRQAQYFAEDAGNVFSLDYNIVHGWNIVVGVGNNGSNPLFINADGADNIFGTIDDDVHVSMISPAIDSGNNSMIGLDIADLDDDGVTFEFTPRDMDMNLRRVDIASIVDSGSGTLPVVDRGPYEAITPCPADTNDDGVVNVTDLLAVISAWGSAGPNAADVNGDNTVNVTDLLAVISAWGGCP